MTRLLDELLEEWQLVPDGDPVNGTSSVVRPVLTEEGRRAVLKLAGPRPEAEHEALALQRWGGRGAVRLLRADPHRRALLLERLTPQDLGHAWDMEACETVAGLYGTLHIAAPPQIERASAYAARRLETAPQHLPRRLVEQARALARDLPDDDRLLHTQLHYGNVLSDGTDWVAISPAPLAGDPHYELAPMLWHRFEELAGRIRDGVRDRFFALVDGAGLDEDRARGWAVVRAVVLAGERPDLTTVAIAVAKAVQD